MRGSLLGLFAAGLMAVAMTAHKARAHGYGYGYCGGYGYTYTAGYSYAPAVYTPAVYVAPAPVVVHRPVVPVVNYVPTYGVTPYTVRVRPRLFRGHEVETTYYTPYGRHEFEYEYDRWGNLRDIDYDFDD